MTGKATYGSLGPVAMARSMQERNGASNSARLLRPTCEGAKAYAGRRFQEGRIACMTTHITQNPDHKVIQNVMRKTLCWCVRRSHKAARWKMWRRKGVGRTFVDWPPLRCGPSVQCRSIHRCVGKSESNPVTSRRRVLDRFCDPAARCINDRAHYVPLHCCCH